MGLPLRVLRPPTPYRMDPGDYVRPHDDRAAPEFRLSLACCLTPEGLGSKGGETRVGPVESVTEYEHPDFFFPLKKWTLRPISQVIPPVFNSVLILVLSNETAHEVSEVTGAPRYSITTLYGDGSII
jgi:Rps23 Pro-64 3,4-dihydroxylase Tpa1-like proline 4-hydroxylase